MVLCVGSQSVYLKLSRLHIRGLLFKFDSGFDGSYFFVGFSFFRIYPFGVDLINTPWEISSQLSYKERVIDLTYIFFYCDVVIWCRISHHLPRIKHRRTSFAEEFKLRPQIVKSSLISINMQVDDFAHRYLFVTKH